MKKRLMKMVCLALAMTVVLSGCFLKRGDDTAPEGGLTYEELLSLNNEYAAQVSEQSETIQRLQESLDKATGKTNTPAGNLVDIATGEGKTFNVLNGTITLPVPVVYPNTSECPSDTLVQLGKNITVRPTNNWDICIDGNLATFYHNSGITIETQISKAGERVDQETVKEQMIAPVLGAIPNENNVSISIFYSNSVIGTETRFKTNVNSAEAQMRIGGMAISDAALTYVTLYSGVYDSAKEEAVEKFLESLQYGSASIQFS